MSTINTTCPYCGVGCGVNASIKQNNQQVTVESVSGINDHPANFGKLCVKGSALHQTLDNNDRLLYPEINGKRVPWEEATQTIADTFQHYIEQYGKESIAFYLSGQLLTEDYYVANKLMKGFIGTANVDTNSRLCMSSAVVGYKRAFGTDTVPCNYEDLECADLIVLIGSNAAWTHPILYQRIAAAKEQRPSMRVVLIDPRKTASDDIADLHLAIKPASDGFLFNGLLNYLISHNFIDAEYIEQFTEGFDVSTQKVAHMSLQATAFATGLSIDELVTFYNWFAHTERSISFYSQGINQSSTGSDKCNAIINCHLATGRIGKPGMGPFSITGQPNAMGGREVGGLANQLAAHMDFAPDDTDRVQRFWQSPFIATEAGLKAVDLFDAIEEGKVKAVWIMATNPAVSLPNANKVKEALAKCETVIVSDFVHNDTSAFANIKLPACGWGEKDGTVTNSERRISRQRALLPALGEAKPDWWALTEVAQKMGYEKEFNYQSPRDIFIEHAQLSAFENNGSRDFDISALSQLDETAYETLSPIQWPVTESSPNGTARMFSDGRFFTKSGKAQFITGEAAYNKAEATENFPLLLNTGRIRDQWHTMTRTGKAANLLGHIDSPFIQIHPDDAARHGIENQQFAKLHNQYGEFFGQVEITSDTQIGQVFSPIHWTEQFSKKGIISAVVSPETDPFSGQPESKATPVHIEPLSMPRWATIVSRYELNLDDFAYWVRIPLDEGFRYIVGINDDFSWPEYLQQFRTSDTHEVKFSDQLNADERYILVEKQSLILGVFSHKSLSELPSGLWLSNLLKEQIEDKPYQLILGETSDGDAMICSCFQVSKSSILNAIDAGADSVETLGEQLKCGTNCGSCKPELAQLINSKKKQ